MITSYVFSLNKKVSPVSEIAQMKVFMVTDRPDEISGESRASALSHFLWEREKHWCTVH